MGWCSGVVCFMILVQKLSNNTSLLFIITAVISVYNLLHFRKTGSLPGPVRPSEAVEDDQTKYAFSANPHDDLDEDIENQPTVRSQRHDDDEYALLHTDTQDGTHPGRPLSWGREQPTTKPGIGQTLDGADTSYHGGRGNYNPAPLAPHTDAPGENPFAEHLPPTRTNVYDTTPAASGSYHARNRSDAGDPFRDDLALSHDQSGYAGRSGRVNFPEAEYHR